MTDKGVIIIMPKYMKKLGWVILVLLLVIAVWLAIRSNESEQNFQGIFIREESPSIYI